MRIIYILPISWGGIPHYAAELANAVSKYADVVVLKPKDSNDELFSEYVKVINVFKPVHFSRKQKISAFSPKNIISFFSFRNIKLIDDINPDIIHFPELYPQSSIFAFLYGLCKRYPVVATLHETFLSPIDLLFVGEGFIYGMIAFVSELLKHLVKPDAVIVHTKKDVEILTRKGLDPSKIAVIPHGAYAFFKKYAEEHVEEPNTILFFGYIKEEKGIKYLIKAVPIVAKEIPNFKVIIAGEGDFSKYSKYIMDSSKYEVYNEFIPNELVARLFQRASILVLPYLEPIQKRRHSGPLTIAFSFGKPVIVTNVGDLPNIARNGKEGLVIPPKDPEALAEAIIRILKDDKLRKEMRRNALKKAEELSWDNIAKMHMKVYEDTIKNKVSRQKYE